MSCWHHPWYFNTCTILCILNLPLRKIIFADIKSQILTVKNQARRDQLPSFYCCWNCMQGMQCMSSGYVWNGACSWHDADLCRNTARCLEIQSHVNNVLLWDCWNHAMSSALECFLVCGLSPECFLLICPDGLP